MLLHVFYWFWNSLFFLENDEIVTLNTAFTEVAFTVYGVTWKKSACGWWKDKKRKGNPPILQHVSVPLMLYSWPQKKKTLGKCERIDEMKGGESNISSCAETWVSWFLWKFFFFVVVLTQQESCAPLVPCSFTVNSSAVTHGSWCQSKTARAKASTKGIWLHLCFLYFFPNPQSCSLFYVHCPENDQTYF